jgi:hypothetical protein
LHAALIRVTVVVAAGADRGGYLHSGKLNLSGSATPATTNHHSFNLAESGEAAESVEAWVREKLLGLDSAWL